jgi:hypothetical protein
MTSIVAGYGKGPEYDRQTPQFMRLRAEKNPAVCSKAKRETGKGIDNGANEQH